MQGVLSAIRAGGQAEPVSAFPAGHENPLEAVTRASTRRPVLRPQRLGVVMIFADEGGCSWPPPTDGAAVDRLRRAT